MADKRFLGKPGDNSTEAALRACAQQWDFDRQESDLRRIRAELAVRRLEAAQAREEASTPRARAFLAVRVERDRQDARWGRPEALPSDRLPDRWLAILTEEVGELAECVTEIGAAREQGRMPDRSWVDGLKKELIEAAAVALSWLEWLAASEPPGTARPSLGEEGT
jgi:NTP pyrophosphatase (non-canonical NTP hydrolase)